MDDLNKALMLEELIARRAYIYAILGVCYRISGQPIHSIRNFGEALKLEALAHEKLGDNEIALKTLEIMPNDSFAMKTHEKFLQRLNK
jgi:hypothetical protein